jgi:hypothetical protein
MPDLRASAKGYQLTDAAQSPDGLGNYGLVTNPTIIAGRNSADAVSFDRPQGITPGTESFQNAYFADRQPSSRVHDWNLTFEKELLMNALMRVAYVGNHATHQDSYDDWNASMPTYTYVSNTKLTVPTGIAVNTALRPNPTQPYGNLQEYRKDGWGWSNGLQVEFQRRYNNGIGSGHVHADERHQGSLPRLVQRFLGGPGEFVPSGLRTHRS